MTIPLLCIPIAFFLIYAAKMPLGLAMSKAGAGYDNRNPRAQQDSLTGWGARARAAHLNGFESFPGFAAAAIVSHICHADAKWSAALAITHVGARTIYPVLYLKDIATMRSVVWAISMLATFGLFLLAFLGG